MEQNKNNSNSNDFLLGVNNSSKNIINNITVVQNNIRNNIKNNIRNNMNMPGMNNNIKEIISSNKNSIEKINIPVSLKNMVYKIINKLEKETVNLDNKIKNFNSEKKKLEEMSSDEIKKLKDIIRKLYNLFFILYKSTDLNKSNTINLFKIKK
jgi:predicted nuclease with TOPRIM domain